MSRAHLRHVSIGIVAAAMMIGVAAIASAAPLLVTNFGDGGWTNGDTRDAGGANVGPAGRLDLNISPPGSPPSGHNALRLVTDTASAKSTIHQESLSLGSIANFSGSYSWYKENAGAPAPAFKLGIDTSDANDPSVRPGESAFDKILIYEPYDNPNSVDPGTGVWVTQTFDLNNGKWWMRDRNLNINVNPPHSSLTLAQWLADGTYGARLSAADIVAIQIGQGSGNAGLTSYVDAASYTYGASPTTVEYVFGDPVPEPATLSLAAIGVLMLARRGRR